MKSTAVSFCTLLATVLAAPAPTPVEKRQSATTCGSHKYTKAQVSAALAQGYKYWEEYKTVGSDSYPHKYNDYEGFDFPVPSPWLEFPIEESGVYTGGSPGADRVIFNEDGEYAGVITHTGASSYDGFVGCSGTS